MENVVQSCRHVQLFVTPWTAAYQDFLTFTISWSLLKLMSIDSVMPSNYPIICHPLLLLHSTFPSIRVFSNESSLHFRQPTYWSFSFNISSFNEYTGLVSFRIDWFDLLTVQGTLKSLLQQHSSKASIFWRSVFFMVQLSHPYMITGKTIALTIQTFVSKVMSQLFNTLCLSLVKNLPAMWETRLRFLGQEDPLEKGMATHSSMATCPENSIDREAWWATVHGVTKSWTRLE